MPFPILFGTTVTTVLHYRADCDELLSLPLLSAMTVSQPDNGSYDDQVSDDDISVSEACVVDVDHISESSVHAVTSDAELNADGNALINELHNDKSLASCHALAAAGKALKVILCTVTECCIAVIVLLDNAYGNWLYLKVDVIMS